MVSESESKSEPTLPKGFTKKPAKEAPKKKNNLNQNQNKQHLYLNQKNWELHRL